MSFITSCYNNNPHGNLQNHFLIVSSVNHTSIGIGQPSLVSVIHLLSLRLRINLSLNRRLPDTSRVLLISQQPSLHQNGEFRKEEVTTLNEKMDVIQKAKKKKMRRRDFLGFLYTVN